MKSPANLQSSILALVCLICFAAPSASAQDRRIRLRNETIVTTPQPGALTAAADERPRSGLHLVQFNAATKKEWIDQLEKRGARVAKYVSDDAYVVRFDGVSESRLKSLPFVHWIGKYERRYKLHEKLAAFAEGDANAAVELRAMLLEDCPEDLLGEARSCVGDPRVRTVRGLGTILSGSATPAQVKALSESEAVLWIEPTSKPKLLGELSAKIVAGDDGFSSTPTITQALGYTGAGVTVAVADSGLDQGTPESVHPDLQGRVKQFLAYGLSSAADGHGHGTHVAGIVAGDGSTGQGNDEGYLHGLGIAPEAEIVVQRIFDGAGGYTLDDDFHKLARDAVRAGADIGSNSWGDESNGDYDLSAAIFDALVRDADDQTPGDQPYILEFSAGNSGSGRQTINSPAVAKNVIATGASQNDWFDFFLYPNGPESMADFSSRGPAADGRIKPDVVAPGTWIASLQTSGGTSDNAWLPISALYQYQGGTSQAGPQVSGAAAALVQYFREVRGVTPSPALTKAVLINSAVNLDDSFGTKPTPNNDEGWGRVDLTSVIGSDREFDFIDQTELLTTGEEFEQLLLVGDPDQPLKVTMTYTDVPGTPFAIPALVNDLDLEVIDPDGRVFRGNQFNNGISVPGAAGRDAVNNVEGVLIERPTVGQYRLVVRAVNVVEDARIDTAGIDQDFALFTTGELPLPGVGIVVLDRPAYTAPSEINIRLVDFDLMDAESVTVHVTSDSDPVGEAVVLGPLPALGAFAGSLPTSAGAAGEAGVLAIDHGDSIEVVYDDASPARQIVAVAEGDLVPPSIFGIRTSSRFGRSVIEWNTDEDAQGSVVFGQTGVLDGTASTEDFGTEQSIVIEDLIGGETYQFSVTVEDRAGNTTSDDNGGTFYSFDGPTAATVLIVDAFYENITLLGLTDVPPPPLSTYTDAFDQIGVSYEVWDVEERGSPTIDDLRPFRAVAWRFPEPSVTPPDFTGDEQDTIAEYLANDGSLLIGSMDLFTRIEGTAFLRDVLQVKSFVTDPGAPEIRGFDREPISAGVSMELDFSHYDLFGGFGGLGASGDPGLSFDDLEFFEDWSDTFTPSTNAVPILVSIQEGEEAGIVGARYPRNGLDVPGKLVLLSFPIDALPENGTPPNNRASFLANVMNFLVPGAEGTGTIEFDRAIYTIPSLATIHVADSDLAGDGSVVVRVFSDSVPLGIDVTLIETPRKGEFQGFVTLAVVGGGDSPGASAFPVAPTDELWATYVDASNAETLEARATIDLVPPAISNVRIFPDYGRVIIRWETSEPADSLVQYGESQIFNRAASEPNLKTAHELAMDGLVSGKTYLCRVVSRDLAGNVVADDNDGGYFAFQPLTPGMPPWSDDLESDLSGWTVVEKQGLISETELGIASALNVWESGRPDNVLASAAHSGVTAWGSNLNAALTEGADSLLMTPAIELTGGNQAVLRFWQNYDFTVSPSFPAYDVTGEIYVTVDNGLTLEELASFTGGRSSGWEPVELDLSAYVGQTIRVGFYFGFLDVFNLDNVIQPGWLIDDLEIVTTRNDVGTLEVASNLSQTTFTIEGPEVLTGGGVFNRYDLLPPGDYSIIFHDVPFYTTPVAVETTLVADEMTRISADYALADSDENGLADDWEEIVFGEVSPSRSADSDSDADGVSDYAEFVTGSNANDGTSRFLISEPIITNGRLLFRWNSVLGRAYRIECSTNGVAWPAVTEWAISAVDGPMSADIPLEPGAPVCFFRLHVMP